MKRPVHFEAVKAHMKQDKNGHVLSLVIHPHDTPEAIWRWPVGQRFIVALAPFDDQEPIDADEQNTRRLQAHIRASCRDAKFQAYLMDRGSLSVRLQGARAEQWSVKTVKHLLGVESLADLRQKPEAESKWNDLMEAFRKTQE